MRATRRVAGSAGFRESLRKRRSQRLPLRGLRPSVRGRRPGETRERAVLPTSREVVQLSAVDVADRATSIFSICGVWAERALEDDAKLLADVNVSRDPSHGSDQTPSKNG